MSSGKALHWAALLTAIVLTLWVSESCSSKCILYNPPNASHCTTIFSENQRVSPPGNLTLEEAERQLGIAFNSADSGETQGSITQSCLDGFRSLYCHQVYTLCEDNTPQDQQLCRSACENITTIQCNETEWSYLRDVIDDVKRNGSIQTPQLLSNCTMIEEDSDCNSSDSDGLSTDVIIDIIVAAGVLALVIIFTVIAISCCLILQHSKRKKKTENKGAYNRDTLMLRPRDPLTSTSTAPPRTGTLLKHIGSKDFRKMSPKQRINALEFPHVNICILKDLPETNFGGSYLGEATGIKENELSTTVYIKSLRENPTSKLRQQFAAEMTWASGFSHPNVLVLLGVCNKEVPRYLIYECLNFGSLKDFLQSIDSAWFDLEQALNDTASTHASSNAPIIGMEDLANISCQLADGMDYLTKRAFVHRDLAARNCQIGHGMRVKIANFGFTYDLHSEDYCQISSLRNTPPLPLRWLAPESLRSGKFSIYSDVWSFGVLLWEVFSFGARPYAYLSNAQVVLQIVKYSHLPCPDNCPESIYEVMERCWSKVPSSRPQFNAVRQELNTALERFGLIDVRKFGRTSSLPRLLEESS